MKPFNSMISAVFTIAILVSCSTYPGQHADLVLTNAEVYTMEDKQPWATGVAITGNRIAAILLDSDDPKSYIGPLTRVIDLQGKFVLPGFIDGHTHFNAAGGLLADITVCNLNLMKADPKDILKMNIEMTIVDGKIVFER